METSDFLISTSVSSVSPSSCSKLHLFNLGCPCLKDNVNTCVFPRFLTLLVVSKDKISNKGLMGQAIVAAWPLQLGKPHSLLLHSETVRVICSSILQGLLVSPGILRIIIHTAIIICIVIHFNNDLLIIYRVLTLNQAIHKPLYQYYFI